jgi:peptidoglycan/LPS O-acetylase OafA/YrhL
LTNIQTKHIPALDGLRGLAILMVICWHYFPTLRIFSIGYTGVDLFFVLSGYLITGRLLATQNEPHYFRKFYRNRILRIFPLYYVVLIIFYAAIFLLTKKENFEKLSFYTAHWSNFFLFTENWSFIFFGLPQEPYLTHFWSLAVEEQFYLVWPFMIYFVSPARIRLRLWCFLVIGVIIIRIFIFNRYGAINHFNTFSRMDSLIIGAILCQMHISKVVIHQSRINRLLIVLTFLIFGVEIVLGGIRFNSTFIETIGYSCIAIFFACLIHVTVQSDNFISRIFKLRFLRFCGKISYGLYVFHWPVLLIAGSKLANWGLNRFPDDILITKIIALAISIVISFVLSMTSYRYFESFFLRLKK